MYPLFYYGYSDSRLLFAMLLVLLLGILAQSRVTGTFQKYNQIPAFSRIPACRMAEELLQKHTSNVSVEQVRGSLTDHFNPKTRTVGLSEQVYHSSSVGALAVAAHEIGHVMQYEEGYLPIQIRNAILPVASFGSNAAPFIVILGLLFHSYRLAMIGVILFAAIFLFQLVTLPVEFNASRRGIAMLQEGGYINYEEETLGAKKVLRAAAMTYVVAALSSFVTLLRLLVLTRGTRRR